MSKNIYAPSAVFHLMVLLLTKGGVLEYLIVMSNISAVFRERTLLCMSITHDVTWSRKDSFCRDPFVDEQPEEKPSVPVKISISQKTETPKKSAFAKFAFGGDRNE